MDNIAANKAIVAEYFRIQEAGDLTACMDMLADDVIWSVPGEWEMAGQRDKAGLRSMMEGLNQFDGGLSFDRHSVTAEEDRVVVFTGVAGRLLDGREYRNQIVFIFTIRDGLIRSVVEMPDSAKSRQFWLGK